MLSIFCVFLDAQLALEVKAQTPEAGKTPVIQAIAGKSGATDLKVASISNNSP